MIFIMYYFNIIITYIKDIIIIIQYERKEERRGSMIIILQHPGVPMSWPRGGWIAQHQDKILHWFLASAKKIDSHAYDLSFGWKGRGSWCHPHKTL